MQELNSGNPGVSDGNYSVSSTCSVLATLDLGLLTPRLLRIPLTRAQCRSDRVGCVISHRAG